MTTLGIIGSGSIGAGIARLAVAADFNVLIANSRGPESLADLVEELGPLATATTTRHAADSSDVVVLAIPLTAHSDLPAALFADKIVIDATNYYPFRDGRVLELDRDEVTTSEFVRRHFVDARLVKAFSNILAHHIPQLACPAGSSGRSALPMAGDDREAKAVAADIIDRLGFDTLDAGSLAQSWRFEPEASAFTALYLPDDTPGDQVMNTPGVPASIEALQGALDRAERVAVADRKF